MSIENKVAIVAGGARDIGRAVSQALAAKGARVVVNFYNNQEEGGAFLVGYNGTLYHIDSDFQVNTYRDGIAAVGCGADYALAVAHVMVELSPYDRIKRALETAAYFSSGVLPPFVVVEV